MKHETYDETDYFMEEVKPLLEKAFQLCRDRNLPIVMAAQYAQSPLKHDDSLIVADAMCMAAIPGRERTKGEIAAAAFAFKDVDMAIDILKDCKRTNCRRTVTDMLNASMDDAHAAMQNLLDSIAGTKH